MLIRTVGCWEGKCQAEAPEGYIDTLSDNIRVLLYLEETVYGNVVDAHLNYAKPATLIGLIGLDYPIPDY